MHCLHVWALCCKTLRDLPYVHSGSFRNLLLPLSGLRLLRFAHQQHRRRDVHSWLRPFFLLVHPDLFGQFPHHRAANDRALKSLNEYLELKESGHQLADPITVQFFLRKPQSADRQGDFEPIKVTLQNDYINTIRHLLSSCQLPTSSVEEYLQSNAVGRSQRSPNASSPHRMWTSDPERQPPDIFSEMRRIRPIVTLRSWTLKNVPQAQALEKQHRPSRVSSEDLQQRMVNALKVKDICWECGWRGSFLFTCLKAFHRLVENNPDTKDIIRDQVVIFGTSSGVTAQGEILLSSGDVADVWLQHLRKVHVAKPIVEWIPGAEKELSSLLGGIKVSRRTRSPVTLAADYEARLGRLLSNARMAQSLLWSRFGKDGLENLELQVAGMDSDPRLTPEGILLVPPACPMWLFIEFVTKVKDEASKKLVHMESERRRCTELIQMVVEEYSLQSLCKEHSVDWHQMALCCQSLLDNPYEVRVSLDGLRVRVGHFFQVLGDGEMVIHWKWAENHGK